MRDPSSRAPSSASETPRRRSFGGVMVRVALAVGVIALVLSASPAEAHEWNVESQSESCVTYSFGTICTVTKTLFRHHDSWCTSGPPPLWPLRVVWYSHCYRNETSTYWP